MVAVIRVFANGAMQFDRTLNRDMSRAMHFDRRPRHLGGAVIHLRRLPISPEVDVIWMKQPLSWSRNS